LSASLKFTIPLRQTKMRQADLQNFQLCPLGDSAMVLQFEDKISLKTNLRLRAISHFFDTHTIPGIIEYVPAYNTITIYYDPWEISEKGKYNTYDRIVELIQHILRQVKLEKKIKSKDVDIPVCYGGNFGPDLHFVSQYSKLTENKIIELHSKGSYLVYMIGFAPGFPYLGGMSKKLDTPRKSQPKSLVPKGSIGIAGNQTGIYSLDTPGGWQIIGRTPLSLFNPTSEKPSLLQAGDKVRFIPISENEYNKMVDHEH
jgi:inhibitor of KinA